MRYYRNLAAEAGEDLSVRAGLAAGASGWQKRTSKWTKATTASGKSAQAWTSWSSSCGNILLTPTSFAESAGSGRERDGCRRVTRPPDDRAGAERTLNRFLQVWERLAAENPGLPGFQSDLATAYGSVGILLGAYSRRGESIQSYRKSIALWESTRPRNPEEPEYKVALVQAYGATAGELSRTGHVKNRKQRIFSSGRWRVGKNSLPKFPLPNVIGRPRQCLATAGIYYQNLTQLDHAIADYSRAIELDPNNANAHFELGDACARLGRWDQAQAEIGRAAELDPGNQWYMFHASVLQLRAGDLAGYRRVCREMLKRFGDTRKPEVAERTAKTCLLAPDAVADLAPVLTLADRAVRGTEKSSNYRYFVLVKGLAESRAGRNAEAVNWVERLSPMPAVGTLMPPRSRCWLWHSTSWAGASRRWRHSTRPKRS